VKIYRVPNPEEFDRSPEFGMDVHWATADDQGPGSLFIVIGGRAAIDVNEEPETPLPLDLDWLSANMPRERRKDTFERWLAKLPSAPVLGYIVRPLNPLPATPARPPHIHGHLPFGAMTAADTVIYRWEAFPTSRRIDQDKRTIAQDTYAAPASEVPFAPTGFGAVARFALPNLWPACFRWEIQPDKTFIECGASVPLYGQSGGGVEVRFPRPSFNRCPIADPVVLPAM
jgi:hypothetical protein